MKAVLRSKIMRKISHSVFCDLNAHVFENEIMKICTHPKLQKIVSYYLDIQMFRYGQDYSDVVLKMQSNI